MLLVLLLTGNFAHAFTVLIDPGHGGEDHGAKSYINSDGKKAKAPIYEKDLTLNLAKKIYKKLKGQTDFQVYLTRSVDRNVTLEERAELAEKIKADLFISVHVNASKIKSSHGFETYYLDNHKDIAIQKVEDLENKNLKGEALVVNQILTDLVIERTMKYSRSLAQNIHGELSPKMTSHFKMADRGIKPGLFYVLAMSKIPGVLLEIGFMTNSKELGKLKQENFQQDYSDAVVKGIKQFFKSYKYKKKSIALF